MRIKKDFLLCFFLVIAVLLIGLLSPASADFKKVNERELARANASLTGHSGAILCPANEESDCVAIPAERELAGGSLSSLHDDYGYDWLKNRSAGELSYEESSVLSPVTVETGRDGGFGADAIYLRIGLGAQELEVNSWDTNVTVDCCSDGDCSYCEDLLIGSLHLDGLKVKTNGNSYATQYMVKGHTGVGVQVDVTVDSIDLATLSWGDPDGFAGASGAGYVGLKNTNISGVTASGSLSIDVAKEDTGVNAVHVAIDSLNVGMSSLDTTVVLGDKKDFSGTKYVLGSLYMKDLKMNVGGYVDIYNVIGKEATTLDFGLKIPSLTLNTLSWGNTDWGNTHGFAKASGPGYVGLRNLVIKNLAIAGRLTVEELCNQAGGTDINHLAVVTGVASIDFNLKVSMDYLNTDVALGNRKDNLNQTLGSIFISGLSANINGTVKISAH